MLQVPDWVPEWKRPIDILRADVEQLRARLDQLIVELTGRGRIAATGVTARMRTSEEPPMLTLVTEQPIIDSNEMVTRRDFEAQSRLARDRMSLLLKGFLETQKARDEDFRETIRTELREELQSFISALDDGAFSITTASPKIETFLEQGDDIDEFDALNFVDDEFNLDKIEGNY
jgi:hypothetical protein